jgi:hypothetical protein
VSTVPFLILLVPKGWVYSSWRILSRSVHRVYPTGDGNGLVAQFLPNLDGSRISSSKSEGLATQRRLEGAADRVEVRCERDARPFANEGIIPMDILASYDVMSNLLYTPTDGDIRFVEWNTIRLFSK